MYPDLLEIFGIQLYGAAFERTLWLLLALLMLWGLVGAFFIWRKKQRAEAAVQGAVSLAILIPCAVLFAQTFSPAYDNVFSAPIVLHSYAFCIIVGIVLGILTARKQARILNINPDSISKLCLALVIFGLLGARAAHVAVDWQTYYNSCFAPKAAGLAAPDCLRILNFAEGGLTFYGGVIAGFITLAVFFLRQRHSPSPPRVLPTLDILASALAIAHACGRIGCLAAGCCWGAVTTANFVIRYGSDSFAFAQLALNPAYHDSIMKSGLTPPMHPTQLYEAGGELLIWSLLWIMLLRHAKSGKMAAFWLIAYGCLRFFVECMRDDDERGYFLRIPLLAVNRLLQLPDAHPTILSTSQGIAIGMVCAGILLAAFVKRTKKS